MDKPVVSSEDIAKVRNFMMFFHQGFVNARPRQTIAEALRMEDRHFREVCSEIPEIITSHRFGYYILPLIDPTGIETRRARDIIRGEDRRRIISLYLRNRRQLQAIRKMENAEKQMELAL